MRSLSRLLHGCPATFKAVSGVLTGAAHSFTPRLPGLTKLMSQFSKTGQWRKALYIYDAMPLLGIATDTFITNAAINACGRGGVWERAVDIFQDMPRQGLSRDIVTYSSTISAMSASGDWRRSLQLFLEMCGNGIAPDACALHALMTAMGMAGKWQLAERIFQALYRGHSELGAFLDLCGPGPLNDEDAVAFSCLEPHLHVNHTRAAAPSSRDSAGPSLTSDGSQRGHSQSSTSNDVQTDDAIAGINAGLMGLQISPTSALHVRSSSGGSFELSDGSAAVPFPAAVPYTPLPSAGHSDSHTIIEPQGALPANALRDVQYPPFATGLSRGGVRSFLISSFLQALQAPEPPTQLAFNVGMLSRDPALSGALGRVCCNTLLAAYSKAEPAQCNRSMTLVLTMLRAGGDLGPDIVSMNTVMRAYANAGQPSECFHIFKMLVQQGLTPTLETFSTLMACAAEAGMAAVVQELWTDLHTRDLTPTTPCVNAFMQALIQQDRMGEAMSLYNAMLHLTSPQVPNSDTLHILLAELQARGQPHAAINVHRSLMALFVPSSAPSTNLLLEAHGSLGHWREAHTAMLAAAETRTLDAAGLLIVLKQLSNVQACVGDTGSPGVHCSILELQIKAIDAGLKSGLQLTADCVEVATATCAFPQHLAGAQWLQADTLVDIFLESTRANVVFTSDSIANILRGCASAGQSILARRILRECMPSLRHHTACAGHAGALVALCIDQSDFPALRHLINLLATAQESSDGAHHILNTASSEGRAPEILPEALCLAAQGLWKVGRKLAALDLLLGMWEVVSKSGPYECTTAVISTLQAAKRLLVTDAGVLALPRSLDHARAGPLDALGSDHRLLNVVKSSLQGRGDPLCASLCTTALLLVSSAGHPSGVARLTDAVVELLRTRTSASATPSATYSVLLPVLLQLDQVPLAATTLLRAMVLDPALAYSQPHSWDGPPNEKHALADVLYHTCEALLARGSVHAASALLLVGHRRGVLEHYAVDHHGAIADPGETSSRAQQAAISNISSAFQLRVHGLSPGITIAMVYAWLADLALSQLVRVAADVRAAIVLRDKGDQHNAGHARLPFVLAALGVERFYLGLSREGMLPCAPLRFTSTATWTFDNTRVVLPVPELIAWLHGLREADESFGDLLTTCRSFLAQGGPVPHLSTAVAPHIMRHNVADLVVGDVSVGDVFTQSARSADPSQAWCRYA